MDKKRLPMRITGYLLVAEGGCLVALETRTGRLARCVEDAGYVLDAPISGRPSVGQRRSGLSSVRLELNPDLRCSGRQSIRIRSSEAPGVVYSAPAARPAPDADALLGELGDVTLRELLPSRPRGQHRLPWERRPGRRSP